MQSILSLKMPFLDLRQVKATKSEFSNNVEVFSIIVMRLLVPLIRSEWPFRILIIISILTN